MPVKHIQPGSRCIYIDDDPTTMLDVSFTANDQGSYDTNLCLPVPGKDWTNAGGTTTVTVPWNYFLPVNAKSVILNIHYTSGAANVGNYIWFTPTDALTWTRMTLGASAIETAFSTVLTIPIDPVTHGICITVEVAAVSIQIVATLLGYWV